MSLLILPLPAANLAITANGKDAGRDVPVAYPATRNRTHSDWDSNGTGLRTLPSESCHTLVKLRLFERRQDSLKSGIAAQVVVVGVALQPIALPPAQRRDALQQFNGPIGVPKLRLQARTVAQ